MSQRDLRALKSQIQYIAKTLYGDEDDDASPDNGRAVEEPKVLGLHPGSNEKVLLKDGPYGHYVQLGEDKKGHLPKRASVSQISDVSSITLEDALRLLRYPITLGKHPDDGQPVVLKLARLGLSVKHRRTQAPVPKEYGKILQMRMNWSEGAYGEGILLRHCMVMRTMMGELWRSRRFLVFIPALMKSEAVSLQPCQIYPLCSIVYTSEPQKGISVLASEFVQGMDISVLTFQQDCNFNFMNSGIIWFWNYCGAQFVFDVCFTWIISFWHHLHHLNYQFAFISCSSLVDLLILMQIWFGRGF